MGVSSVGEVPFYTHKNVGGVFGDLLRSLQYMVAKVAFRPCDLVGQAKVVNSLLGRIGGYQH